MDQHHKQVVVSQKSATSPHNFTDKISLHNADGSSFTGLNLPFAPVVTGSAIGTVGKSTTSPEPAANTLVPIRFTNGNSAASVTMAFNGGTARAIHLGGAAVAAAELAVAAGGVALFWFDGTVLYQLGAYT